MRILILGSGGREHAIAWKLGQTPDVQLFGCPGNPGMAEICACAAGDPLAYAEYIGADLTVVGPEAPLAQGIVDRFRGAGKLIVGPVQAAARLEASKSYAKEIMQRAGVPTAKSVTAASAREALDALKHFSLPVVLKADGLAAGKGVVIAQTREEAESAARQLFQLAPPLVIEEFLDGEEVSFIVLSDGRRSLAFDATQDHKAVHDGDTGPNTGGMGAYCDGRILSQAEKARVMDTIIEPVIATMNASGAPFTGFLYAGLMMTSAGARVLEFNARLGDPETQVLMHRMAGDFVDPLLAAARGDLGASAFSWRDDPSVCVVLAANGYPGVVRSGDLITGIEETPATIFQAGTRRTERGLETSGGRVLGVTASGNDLETAIQNAYAGVEKVHFDGMHYRKDIGAKGLKRWRG